MDPPLHPDTGRLGVYALGELLGEGATSRVFRATHLTFRTDHAVKILKPERMSLKDRFLEEGRALAMLRHPNVVAVHAIVEEGDTIALVMELVEGEDLETWRLGSVPSLDLRLRVFGEIVAAVREVHRHGYVHRDLKPANVLMTRVCGEAVPKLADLGIARRPGPRMAGHTLSGVAMGTPRYMPPEQIRDAARADARSDIFALGVMLYELLADRLPFSTVDLDRLHAAMEARDYAPLTELADRSIPGELADLVDRMLSPAPADRPASCDEVLAALPAGLAGTEPTLVARSVPRPIRPRARRALALGLVTLIACIFGTAWTSRASHPIDVDALLAEAQPPTCDPPVAPVVETAPRGTLVLADGPSSPEARSERTEREPGQEKGIRLFRKKDRAPSP